MQPNSQKWFFILFKLFSILYDLVSNYFLNTYCENHNQEALMVSLFRPIFYIVTWILSFLPEIKFWFVLFLMFFWGSLAKVFHFIIWFGSIKFQSFAIINLAALVIYYCMWKSALNFSIFLGEVPLKSFFSYFKLIYYRFWQSIFQMSQ